MLTAIVHESNHLSMSMIVYNIIVMSTKYTAIVIILYVIIVTISH